MSLIDQHEEILAISVEDETKFGVPIILKKPDDTEYNFIGLVNIISRHVSVDSDAEAVSKRSNCTIRLSTFITKTGISLIDIESEILGWEVITSPRPSIQDDKNYLIEDGGVFPDEHLGTIVIFLTELELTE